MDTCKWPESCKIKFWTPCTSTIEPLLAVLEDQVAQVQPDICGPFVCSNPTQFKLRLLTTFKMSPWHLRAVAAESRTQRCSSSFLLFMKYDLANWLWSGQFRMSVRGITLVWAAMFFAGAKRNLQLLVSASLSLRLWCQKQNRGVAAPVLEKINNNPKVEAV